MEGKDVWKIIGIVWFEIWDLGYRGCLVCRNLVLKLYVVIVFSIEVLVIDWDKIKDNIVKKVEFWLEFVFIYIEVK